MLWLPKRGGCRHTSQTSKIFQACLNRWGKCDFAGLWSDAIYKSQKQNSQPRPKGTGPRIYEEKNHRVISAAQDGQYAKAAKALSSFGLAPTSAAVLEKLQHLHPPASSPPTTPAGAKPDPIIITEKAVKSALRSFSEGTAPDPSSMRASFLKEAVFCLSLDQSG